MFTPVSGNPDSSVDQLRLTASAARKAITGAERVAATLALTQRLLAVLNAHAATRVGSYRAYGAEVDPQSATANAEPPLQLYLPKVIAPNQPLRFLAVDQSTQYQRSSLGIDEPIGAATVSAAALCLILIPLLAFDRAGTRLGHGGGYYDRSLAECASDLPLRVGVAYSCQEMPELPRREWDQPLHLIVTEEEIIECPKNLARNTGC